MQFIVLDRRGFENKTDYQVIRRHIDISANRNQETSCRWTFYSLSRTACGRGNHPPRRVIQGVEIIEAENLARLCAEFAADKKAENIVVLDLREISTFTDFFVICSAGSEPQLKAIAGEIETRLKKDTDPRRRRGWFPGEPVDRARLPAGGRPRLSPRQTRVLQPRRPVGRCAAPQLGNGDARQQLRASSVVAAMRSLRPPG